MLLSLLLSTAFAAAAPIVTKTSRFTPAEPFGAYEKMCEIYSDHVIDRQTFGKDADRIQVEQRQDIQLTGPTANWAAKAATEDLLESKNATCGLPTTEINAGSTLLFSNGGCNRPRLFRQGLAARTLMALVDQFCPKTYDF